MSSLLRPLLIVFGLALLAGACSKDSKQVMRPAGAVEHATIAIEGMTCGSCVSAITKALKDLPGVQAASVDLKTKRAQVRHQPDKVTLDTLVATINKLGYKANVLPPGLPVN